MTVAIIIAAGDCQASVETTGYIIAADGGLAVAIGLGVHVDLALGDFDSLDASIVPEQHAAEVLRLPREKDDTDTHAAVQVALERGFTSIYIYGGVGGRIDHTLSNLASLSYIARHGAVGYLVSRDETMTIIRNGSIEFDEEARGTVSVLAYGGEARGVCLAGLKYTLCDATLSSDKPIGVSNEFTGRASSISVRDGEVVVVFPRGTRIN